ncbi:MAG: rod shape-determining protein MreC [Chloroflexota bacterium]
MRTRTGLLALVAIVGVVVVLGLRVPQVSQAEGYLAEIMTPIETVLTGAFRPVSSVFETVFRAADLQAENERLRQQNEEYSVAAVRVQELEHQVGDLEAQLGYRQAHPDQELIPANVIAREPNALVHSITIDKGTNDGINEGMTVVSPAGLVGRVLQTGPASAKVLLITDSKSSVSGVIVSTRAQGMVYGRRQRQLTMRYLDQMEDIQIGQWVVTSSIGGGFPAGIPVGRVIYVRQRDIEPFQEATLEPAVDFDRLESVMVITSFLPVSLE